MSEIYDNWERLVAAVLRKEELWALFHAPSRSPSISSQSSSDFTSSPISFRLEIEQLQPSDFSSSFRSCLQIEELQSSDFSSSFRSCLEIDQLQTSDFSSSFGSCLEIEELTPDECTVRSSDSRDDQTTREIIPVPSRDNRIARTSNFQENKTTSFCFPLCRGISQRRNGTTSVDLYQSLELGLRWNGLQAGSALMLLTVIWGTCVVFGKWDIEDSLAIESRDTKGFSLTGSGIRTDRWTSCAGIITAISVVPFIIVQLPQILHSNSGRHLDVLIALIVSVSLLISYCPYQVFPSWIQRRRRGYKHKLVISGILKHLKLRSLGKLVMEDGRPNVEVLRKLFNTLDENYDGYLSHAELRALVVGIRFDKINLDFDDAVEMVMKDFDTSRDCRVDMHEFITGVSRWGWKRPGVPKLLIAPVQRNI